MSLFAIIGHDVADSSAQRQITRAEHVERLQALVANSALLLLAQHPLNMVKARCQAA